MKTTLDAAYDYYDIETYRAVGEPSASSVRAQPVAGQGLPASMKVSCCSAMRRDYPVGTVFRIKAQVVEHDTGTKFLYTHFSWPFEVISKPDCTAHRPTGGTRPAAACH